MKAQFFQNLTVGSKFLVLDCRERLPKVTTAEVVSIQFHKVVRLNVENIKECKEQLTITFKIVTDAPPATEGPAPYHVVLDRSWIYVGDTVIPNWTVSQHSYFLFGSSREEIFEQL